MLRNLVPFTLLTLGLAAAVPLSAAAAAAPAEPGAVRLYVQRQGVYRVTYEALTAAGLKLPEVASSQLALSCQGHDVPLWVVDGGDGRFGAGDHIEFVGEQLHGDDGLYYHEVSKLNVYWLTWGGDGAARMTSLQDLGAASAGDTVRSLRQHQHLELDSLLIRLTEQDIRNGDSPDVWFWAKLSHIDAEPVKVPLAVTDMDLAGGPSTVRVHFRALSQLQGHHGDFPDHEVQLTLNGRPLGVATWDGKTTFRFERSDVPPELWNPTEVNTLELRVPARTPPGDTAPGVDVVMLDWIELEYPRRGDLGRQQTGFDVAPEGQGTVRLTAPGVSRLAIYGDRGSRVEVTGEEVAFQPPADETRYLAVPDDRFYVPVRMVLDQPSDLHATFQQADYLMITAPKLRATAEQLAAFHRSRGLTVKLVDVDDVYDEFNYGIEHPKALRDFISYAYHQWSKPAPRFVLLVGDASWDTKNATVDDANYANWTQLQLLDSNRFVPKDSAVYTKDAYLNRRNLIPTWTYHSGYGHSASDNWFVSVDGDDFLPDLAIGRFPVTEPEEVAAIVRKTIRYAVGTQVGPWRRRILWITNDEKSAQRRSDHSAALAGERGFAAVKIYPQAEEPNNEQHQRELRQAFDQGQLLVHFFGHGGRYIWRTGPPDLRKNHDLFTLEDLDQLKPNARLPVVLSMTCFSAPFDHPNADSIGEKFLRLEDRGAVAVIAASWRNSPTQAFSNDLVRELTQPGATVGEGLMRAKRAQRNRMLVEQYNLLGDPAVPMALPRMEIPLKTQWTSLDELDVSGQLPTLQFHGQATVDWLDQGGTVVASEQINLAEPAVSTRFPGTPEELAKVRSVSVYAWSLERNMDALGHLDLPTHLTAAGATTAESADPATAPADDSELYDP